MARVFTAKAAKDYPAHDIKKGDVYYYWSAGFRGPKQMSKTMPRPSQTTANDKLSTLYSYGENFEDALKVAATPEDVAVALDDYAEGVREVVSMYEESFENMPEGLQQGDVGQQLESNKDELDAFADELDSAADEVRGLDVSEYIDEDRVRQEAVDELDDGASEDDIEALVEKTLSGITEFENLDENEQREMLEAALDIANSPSCPL